MNYIGFRSGGSNEGMENISIGALKMEEKDMPYKLNKARPLPLAIKCI